jgi:hypothetical protein
METRSVDVAKRDETPREAPGNKGGPAGGFVKHSEEARREVERMNRFV